MAWRRVTLVFLLAVVGVPQLTGCGCDSDSSGWDNVSVEELAEDVDVIFVGTPVHEDGSALTSRTRYVFEVSSVYRGTLPTEVLVEIDPLGACGPSTLVLDIETALFGRLDDEGVVHLVAWKMAFEQQVIDTLGEGVAPTREIELPRPNGLRVSRLFGSTALLYAGFGLGGLAIFTLAGKWVSGSRD